ncbi:MAG: hypothetical protein R2847_10155 [Bacteroidia bacterium]
MLWRTLHASKPSPTPQGYGDIRKTINDGKARMLNVLTPHGKWHIHSTYGDTCDNSLSHAVLSPAG